MGGNRLVVRPSAHLWSVSGTTAAHAIPDGKLIIYSLPAIREPTHHTLPPRPTALCLRLPSAPRSNPPYIVGTHTGQILLPRPIASLSGSIAFVDYLPEVAVAITASELAVFDPISKALLSTHTIRHASPLTCVALTSNTHAVVASQLISLVDLSNGNTVRTYTGHKTPVIAAARLPQQRLITASSDKFLSVWDVNQESSTSSRKRRRKASSPPHHTLIAPAPVTSISVEDSDPDAITVAAVCSTASVAVWRNYSPSDKPAKPSFVVRANEQTPLPSIFVSAFTKGRILSVLHGNPFNPSLHSIELNADTDLVLPSVSNNIISENAEVQSLKHNEAKLDLVDKSVALEVANMSAAPERRKLNGVVRDSLSEKDERRNRDEEDDVVDEEPTLQDKLTALGLSKDSDTGGFENSSARKSLPKEVLEPIQVDSRASVLLQAIRSKDSQLFDTCIRNTHDRNVIRKTLDLVPSSIATTDLLHMLIDRLQKFPRRADDLIVWIREILIWHASALISQQRHPALEAMLSVIDSRTRAYEALTRLEGRLELVVGQVERIQRMRSTKLEQMIPRAEYNEEEESEEESSDEENDSDSEESASDDGKEEKERDGREEREAEEEEEGETGDSSDSEESSGEESDEEMQEAAENGNMSTDKDSADGHRKMNGSARSNSADSESESGSKTGSDDGD